MLFILTILKTHWKKIAIGAGIFILLVSVFLVYDGCKAKPTIDLETVNKINNANEKEAKEELTKKVQESADVIVQAEETTRNVELTVDERNRLIQEKIAEAEKKVAEAKNQNRDVTQEELQCLLVPSDC